MTLMTEKNKNCFGLTFMGLFVAVFMMSFSASAQEGRSGDLPNVPKLFSSVFCAGFMYDDRGDFGKASLYLDFNDGNMIYSGHGTSKTMIVKSILFPRKKLNFTTNASGSFFKLHFYKNRVELLEAFGKLGAKLSASIGGYRLKSSEDSPLMCYGQYR